MLSRIISSLRNSLGVGRLASIIGSALFIGVVSSLPAEAKCFRNPITGKQVCSIKDLDPTTGIPGSKEFAEQAWGEAGGSAYQAAADVTRGRNGGSQGLDELQKWHLRPHFGNLVDQVAIIYSARMMDQWSAFGKEINLSGIDTAAQTYCNRIYVRDPYKSNNFQQLVTLSHEMTHSRQCEQLGGEGKFGFHYFREYKRAGQNYENNKLEREAFNFQNQFANSYVDYYEERTRQLYRQILGREADPSGFRDNVNAMKQHDFEWVRSGMAGSQESRNNINNLYRQHLCRDAEPSGMDHHVNLLASGQMALDQIRNGIANSTEAQQHKNGCR
jgi:hypothetical protein